MLTEGRELFSTTLAAQSDPSGMDGTPPFLSKPDEQLTSVASSSRSSTSSNSTAMKPCGRKNIPGAD